MKEEITLAEYRALTTRRPKRARGTLPTATEPRSDGAHLGDWSATLADRLLTRGLQVGYDSRQFVYCFTRGRETAHYATLRDLVAAVEGGAPL